MDEGGGSGKKVNGSASERVLTSARARHGPLRVTRFGSSSPTERVTLSLHRATSPRCAPFRRAVTFLRARMRRMRVLQLRQDRDGMVDDLRLRLDHDARRRFRQHASQQLHLLVELSA